MQFDWASVKIEELSTFSKKFTASTITLSRFDDISQLTMTRGPNPPCQDF